MYYEKVKEKVSYKEFKKRIEEFDSHFNGLLDEETLELLAAYSFGYEPKSKIEELANKRGKVVVEGIVEKTFGIREFKNGIFSSIILSDESGRVRVTLWNDAAKLVKTGDIVEGAKIRLRGFLKRREEIEISVNDASDIEILDFEYLKISEVVNGFVNVKGRVSGFGGLRKTSKDVEVAEIYVSDKSGRVRVLLWGDKAKYYRELDIGDEVEIRNGYVKMGRDGEIEIHCGWKSFLKI